MSRGRAEVKSRQLETSFAHLADFAAWDGAETVGVSPLIYGMSIHQRPPVASADTSSFSSRCTFFCYYGCESHLG